MVKKSLKYYLDKIPENYRFNIEYIGEDEGSLTSIVFINKICKCKSKTTIKAILARNQLDFCKSCHNIKKNKANTLDFNYYLNKIPLKYRCNIKQLNNNGYHSKIEYTHQLCKCKGKFNIGDLAKKKQFDLCKKCTSKNFCLNKTKTFEFYLNKIPKHKSRVLLVGEYCGINSLVMYNFECGCSKQMKLKVLLNRVKLDVCDFCISPICNTKNKMINYLNNYVKNIVILDGFPGNKTTIISCCCNNCGQEIIDTYFNLQQYYTRNKNQCKNCAPKSKNQNSIFNFINDLGVNVFQNNISTIKFNNEDVRFKELDIFCPKNNFAIEYNGLYFHSEKFKNDRYYHWKKTKAASSLGIDLLHIWEDKWNTSSDIYKSIIKNKLGLTENKFFARKTLIKEISKKEINEFFKKNHLDGSVNCITGWGLFYNNELLQTISIRKVNRQNKKYKNYLEIARSATKINCIVVGGESKLLSIVEKYAVENNFEGILNYVDANFGLPNKNKWKFSFVGVTQVSYFYIKEHDAIRVSRQKLQKRNNISEKEYALNNGLLRVNNNKNYIYEYKINSLIVEEGDDGSETKVVTSW